MKCRYLRLLAANAAAIILALSLNGCSESHEKALASAKAEYAAGETRSAIIRLRNVLQAEPQLSEARLLLGQILLETGEPAAAEKELRKAYEAGADGDTVKPLLARALLELGDYQKLLADFPPQQIQSADARADVLVSQAYAQLFQGNVEAARQAMQQAIAAHPAGLRTPVVSALLTGVDGNYEAASTAIDQVLATQPKSVEALRAKATIAQGKGDLSSAIQALQALTRLRTDDVGAHYAATSLLWQAGRIADARAQVERMQAAAPNHPRTQHLLALLAIRDEKPTAARDHIAQALKGDPDFGPTLLLSGMVNSQLGDYELAEKDLSKLLARNASNLAARQALINLLLRTQRTDRALALAKELVADAPRQPEALKVAAAAYLQAGDAKTAQPLFEKVTTQGATDARVLTGLALARMASGDTNLGISTLIEASAADESAIEADLALVRHYVARKEFDKALASLAVMAKKRPGDVRILLLEGEVLFAAGRKAEARTAFERTAELQPDSVVALRQLARLDLAENKPEAAKKRFEDAIARQPKEANFLLAYAEWLNGTNADPATVRATIEKAVALAPSSVNPHAALIAFHAQRQDYERALLAAEEATTAIPGNERLLTALAEIQSRSGKPELAAVTLARAIQIAPASPELLVLLADVQQAMGASDLARESLRKALSLRAGFKPATVRLVAIEEKAGSPAAAIQAARELQRSQPSDPIGYSLEARILAGQGKWPEAIRVYRAGFERSNSPQLVIGLHQALLKSGKADEAVKVVADWLKAHPKDMVVRSYLADMALAAGSYPAAVRMFKEVVADTPNNVRALNNLAFAASRAGDQRALEYAEQAHRLAPNDPNILDTLGSILVERGDVARGAELLKRASAAEPNAAIFRLNLANALIKSGDKQGARRELEALAALGDKYPRQDEVKKLLAGL